MATYTVATAAHETLVASVVDKVLLTGSYGTVHIINRTTVGEIYIRLDGTNPTLMGDESFVVMNSSEGIFAPPNTGAIDVRLICVGGAAYSVEGV